MLERGPLTLVNVHLHFNSLHRDNVVFIGDTPLPIGYDTLRLADQIEHLLSEIEPISGPLVVMGDFNMSDREPGYKLLTGSLRDAFREAGWGFGFTFPNKKRFG
ncbi:MAG: hypothetical protein HC828_20205, partial [Blastochloris sp.]|nr:hypothetical protein [Blastochloris sp.]